MPGHRSRSRPLPLLLCMLACAGDLRSAPRLHPQGDTPDQEQRTAPDREPDRQPDHSAGRQLEFVRVDLAGTRPDEIVRSIVQDGVGFIWAGSREGIVRHDGIRSVRVPLPAAAEGDSNESVHCMAVGADGGVWFGTSHGLAYAEAGATTIVARGERARSKAERMARRIDSLCVDARGRVWLVGPKLRRFDPTTETTETIDVDRLQQIFGDAVRSDYGRVVTEVRADADGNVWLLTSRGLLARVDGATGKSKSYEWQRMLDGVPPTWAYDLSICGDEVLLGTSAGWFRFDAKTRTCTELRDGDQSHVGGNFVRCALHDRDGQLWLGTAGNGLRLIERRGMVQQHFRRDPRPAVGLPSDSIRSLLQDRSGALWIGTTRGLVRCDARRRFRRFTIPLTDDGDRIRRPGSAILETSDGTVWFGSSEDGIGQLDPEGELVFHHAGNAGLPEGQINAIVEADPDHLWLATRHGIHLFDRQRTQVVSILDHRPDDPGSLSSNDVRALALSADGTLWIACSDGLDHLDTDTGALQRIDLDALLGAGRHRFVLGGLYHGRANDLFVVMLGGRLLRIDLTTQEISELRLEPAPDRATAAPRRVFAVTDVGPYLVLATQSGLYRCARDGSQLQPIHAADDSLQQAFPAVVSDAVGNLWAGTTTGDLVYLDADRENLRTFQQPDGTGQGPVFFASLTRSSAGELLFTCEAGIVRFDARDVLRREEPPRVALTAFRVHGEDRPLQSPGQEPLVLAYQENFFSFDFAAFTFVDPSRTRYAYQLEGYDDDWIDGGTRTSVHYTNVPAGEYAFRMKAANADGVWSQASAAFRFSIRPALWQTAWFQVLAALLLLTLLGCYWLYARTLARHGRQLKEEFEGRTHAQAKSRQLEEQLRQAQKMEAVGRLAGGVAHDFNNLLTAILGHAEVARMALASPANEGDVADSLGEIKKAAERAAGLTRQLMMFSRGQSTRPTACNVNTLLRDLERMIRPLVRENIQTDLILADGLQSILIDEVQFGQVVLNLVVNASDAMPNGGRLAILTRAATGTDEVEIVIEDNGRGIATDEQERIFEPFYSTKPVGRGSGLGLATVHGIVRQAGGTIEVASAVGVGTTFYLRFPAIDDEPSMHEAADESVATEVQGQVVLVCEDDDPVRQLTTRILQREGYRVIECPTPDEALGIASDASREIDLLVTDVIMPQMNGRDLAAAIRDIRPALPVLFVSGYTADVLGNTGLTLDDVNYLAKPFSARELLERVRRVLAAGR